MEFINKHKGKILTLITFVMVIIIFTTSFYTKESTFIGDGLSYIVSPIQKYLGKFSGWVEDNVDFWKNAGKLEDENKQLTEEIEKLKAENNLLKSYEVEYTKLTELLDLKKKYNYPTVGAEIIAKDIGNWYESFSIDKGNKDGLSADMVVLAQFGLVGKITETSSKSSKVIPIIDDRSSVSAKNLRTGDVGLVKGDHELNGLCKMENIDADAEIIVGDEIVTSHLSDIYPSGITIGYIKEIRTNSDGLTKDALIEPVVDFKHIESVLVINRKEIYTEE